MVGNDRFLLHKEEATTLIEEAHAIDRFLSFPVGKGNHEIEMVYRPRLLKEGALVSGLAALLLLALATLRFVKKRRKSVQSGEAL